MRPKTDLERAVHKALGKSENVIKDNKALTDAEEKLLKTMSLEEARERHRQLQKMRVLQSYQESKLKRRAKIKSKKYHRLLKKEKIKVEMKEFEEAKNKDPEKALEKLKQLEKMRALERASLKHLNTGKWSKHNKLRAKYDQSAREAMSQQMEINRRLMSEVKTLEEEEPEESDLEEPAENTEVMGADEYDNDREFEDNPWIRRQSRSKTIIESCPVELELEASESRLSDSETEALEPHHEDPGDNLDTCPRNVKPNVVESAPITSDEEADETADHPKAPMSSQKQKPAKKEQKVHDSKTSSKKNRAASTNHVDKSKTDQKDSSIDPKKVLEVETKKIGVSFPKLQEVYQDDESSENEDLEDDDERRKMIAEAFADDDVIADFISEKRRKQQMEGSKDICTFLPGWGHWSGPGMRPNKRLKKKLTIRALKKRRQDDTIGNAIISEDADKTIKNLMVSLTILFETQTQIYSQIFISLCRSKIYHSIVRLLKCWRRLSRHQSDKIGILKLNSDTMFIQNYQ